MVPPMEELCGWVTEWRDILLGKGLGDHAAQYIIMVGRRAVVGYSENASVVSVRKECRPHMCTGCKSRITRRIVVCMGNYN